MWRRRRPTDGEFGQEIQSHIALDTDRLIAEGMRPEEAKAVALRAFGNVTRVHERFYESRRVMWLNDLQRDLRYAFRTLVKNPGFTTVAVLTLGLGIGATTGIFSLVNAVLIRSLPYRDAQRLAYIGTFNPKLADVQSRMADAGASAMPPSNADFLDLQRDTRSFSTLALFSQTSVNLSTPGPTERVAAARVTGEFFHTLEATPLLGRAIDSDDERQGGGRVAVISHGLWQSQFRGDANVFKSILTLNGQAYQIIGVMPPGFSYPGSSDLGSEANARTDLWLPMRWTPEQRLERDFPSGDAVIGRLRPNVSFTQAQAEMSTLMTRLDLLHSSDWRGWYPVLKSFNETVMGKARPLIWLLFGAVLLVLLIACGNAAHLLLARASSRTHEMGVRMGLGAGRARLVRQMLTEALLLASGGGVLGVAIAYAAIRLIPLIDPGNIPRLEQASIDGRVLLFSTCASLLTGILFGLFPAIIVSQTAVGELLKRGGSRGATGVLKYGRHVVIVMEVGMSVMLLSGAALLIHSYVNLQRADRGFSASTLTMQLSLDRRYPRPEQRRGFFRSVLSTIRSLPGVQAAGAVSALPLSHSEAMSFFFVKGYANRNDQLVNTRWVTAQYFDAMRTRLVEGRFLTDDDVDGRQHVVVINEAFAKTYFRGETALGKEFRVHDVLNEGNDRNIPWSTIVGVVAGMRHSNLEDAPAPQVYSSYWQGEAASSLYIAIRTAVPLLSATSAIQKAVQTLDAALAVSDIRVMDDLISQAGAKRRFQTFLLTAFAGIAVSLAAVGLYGLMAYTVKQRTAEIGVRLALGAQRADIRKLILAQGMGLTAVGVAVGTVGALGLTRFLNSMLYGLTRTDPVAFGAVLLVLVAVALAACLAPTSRACRVDPLVALRCE